MQETDGRQVEATAGVDRGNNTPSRDGGTWGSQCIHPTIDGGGMKTHGQYSLPYHGLKEKRPSSAPGAMHSERVLPRSS